MIEEELRRLLQAPRQEIPMWTDPVRRVRAGMRRRLRRAVAVTLAAVSVAAGTGAAVGGVGNLFGTRPSVSPAEPSAEAVIPWVERRAPKQPGGQPLRLPAAPPCPAADLQWTTNVRATLITEPGDTDVQQVAIGVVNLGARPCTLAGRPPVRFTAPVTGPLARGRAEEPAVIEPGEAAFAGIVSRNNCPGVPISYSSLEAQLEGGLPFALERLSIVATCQPVVNEWRRESVYEKAPFRGLTAKLVAPASVKAGADLTYLLELTNIAGTDLWPCLRFRHRLVTSSRNEEDLWELTCVKQSIAPGETLRYQMRLQIPQEAATGRNLVLFEGEWGPSAGAQIELTS